MIQPESQKPPEQRARDMARLCAEELLKDPDDERVIAGIFRNIPLQQLIEASDKCTLLEQQLAEARKDTERLNFVQHGPLAPLELCPDQRGGWHVLRFNGVDHTEEIAKGNSIRQAITLAMKEKSQ